MPIRFALPQPITLTPKTTAAGDLPPLIAKTLEILWPAWEKMHAEFDAPTRAKIAAAAQQDSLPPQEWMHHRLVKILLAFVTRRTGFTKIIPDTAEDAMTAPDLTSGFLGIELTALEQCVGRQRTLALMRAVATSVDQAIKGLYNIEIPDAERSP